MKLRFLFMMMLLILSSTVFSTQGFDSEARKARVENITPQQTNVNPFLFVTLYLSLFDDTPLSSIMAQAQMTITLNSTLEVRAIEVTTQSSSDGSCSATTGTCLIDNGLNNTVSLVSGKSYITTDNSNRALQQGCGTFSTTTDNQYQLLDNASAPTGVSICIPGGGACDAADNCGWSGPQTWEPSQIVCDTANEGGQVSITCPNPTTVQSIEFASYGTPTGSCGNFALGACHAATSVAVVEAACLGQTSCTVNASNGLFGDPCSGTPKRLYVEVTCA
ncbi:MAG: hypothetical protein K0U37_01295 [Gammaproteobacteria bacterium]|nr:hypothetical protein [Gammaproteobacteria bacterium]